MNTLGLLDQLLKSGLSRPRDGAAPGRQGTLEALLGGSGSLGGMLGGRKSALASGALGLLLGKRRHSRRTGGLSAIQRGGLVALGLLAYKAYGNWQARQGGAAQTAPRTLDRLPADQAEGHSQAILKALVAAAKADGHVDEDERQLIETELGASGDAEWQRWLRAELNKPLDPAEVARAAVTPEMASEMYLASLMVVDDAQFMERAYLDELARALRLDPALKAELEAQAGTA